MAMSEPPGPLVGMAGDHPGQPPVARRRRTIAAVVGGAAVIVLVVVIVAVLAGGSSPVVSTTTDTPAPPAPNPAAMPAAGTELWNTDTGPLARLSGEAVLPPTGWVVSLAGGTAVMAPGIGYWDSDEGNAADTVLGVNARTGAVRWRWQRNGWRLEAIAASAANGVAATLWITNPATLGNSYALTMLDLRTGRLDWMRSVVGSGASSGQVVIVGPEVVALADDAASAFAASGGRPLWRHAAPAGCDWGVDSVGAASSEITLGDAAVFPYGCGGADSGLGGIARLAPATGATIWQRRLPSAPQALAQAAGSVAVIRSTGLSDDAVAQVFDVATGRTRFSTTMFATQEYTGMLAVDRAGNVYVLAAGPADSEMLVCVDGGDSRVLWSVPLGQEYLALSVGVVGGQVVVGGLDTSLPQGTPELRLFSAATGTQLAQHSTPQFTYGVMSGWDSAFALEPGLVVVGDSTNQEVRGAVSLPQLTGTS